MKFIFLKRNFVTTEFVKSGIHCIPNHCAHHCKYSLQQPNAQADLFGSPSHHLSSSSLPVRVACIAFLKKFLPLSLQVPIFALFCSVFCRFSAFYGRNWLPLTLPLQFFPLFFFLFLISISFLRALCTSTSFVLAGAKL